MEKTRAGGKSEVLDRLTFLRASAAGTASLALGLFRLRPAVAVPAVPGASPSAYDDWRDVYRRSCSARSSRRSLPRAASWQRAAERRR